MDALVKDSLLNLPDEVIEYIMSFLSFADLSKLSEAGKRLEDCVRRVSKTKPFHIAVIGGCSNYMHPPKRFLINFMVKDSIRADVEVVSIVNDSVSYSDKVIPSLPKDLFVDRGARFSNGDLICEGYPENGVEYWRLKDGSNQWENVGKSRDIETRWNSTFLIDRCFVSMDNLCSSSNTFSQHEMFTKEYFDKKEEYYYTIVPHNYGHTATLFGQHKMFICGGFYSNGFTDFLSQKTFIYDIKEDRKKIKKLIKILKISKKISSWIEGPPLITPRACHSSCVFQLDDGSVHCILIGGETKHEGEYSKSTEIFSFNDQTWVEGPALPCGISSSACVAAPRLSNFACVVIGGDTEEKSNLQNVYGLSKNLSEWKLLGMIKKGRRDHILLPLDYTI